MDMSFGNKIFAARPWYGWARLTGWTIYISEYVQVEHVKRIQHNWSRRLPLRHKNVASKGATLNTLWEMNL